MAVPKSLRGAKGMWRGTSKLNLPWLAPDKQVTESPSSLHIDFDALEKFATLTYTWLYEGKSQEGTLLVAMGAKSQRAEMGWADSWHQAEGILHLKGEDSGASVKARGEYGDKEVWGWTIELTATESTFRIKMDNVPPTGDAMWAVDATYTRD